MRPIFITPNVALEERMRMLKQLNLKALSSQWLEYLDLHLKLLEMYRNLPLGLNLSERKAFKSALKEEHSVHSLKQLTKKLRDQAQRYTWNQGLSYWLSRDEAWLSQNERWHFKRKDWEAISPYSYYFSEDLRFLEEHVLTKIDTYTTAALKEVNKVTTPKNAAYQEHLDAFRDCLKTLESQVRNERYRLVQAMLARLELVALNQICQHDDVMFYVSEQLRGQGIDWNRTPVGPRPYQAASDSLSTNDFHYFHHFIMTQGDEKQKQRCQKLPWVTAKEYVYDEKSRQWRTHARLIAGIKIPKSRWRPTWLFRVRNARYDAFHDITKILAVRFASQSAKTLEERLKRQQTREHKAEDYQKLYDYFTQFEDEVQRIDRIRKKLIPVIHSRSRRVLKVYRNELYQRAEQVILAQLSIVQKARTDVASIIDQNEKLEHLLTLADQLSKSASFFPKDYRISITPSSSSSVTLKEMVKRECSALKNQIATQKIGKFVLGLQYKQFKREMIYDQNRRSIYRLPQAESVKQYLNRFKPYLNPNQDKALYQIQRIMQGYFVENSNVVTYAALQDAASQLVKNPDDILIPLFQRYILPSVVSTETAGYQLLLDFERHYPEISRQRSAVLSALEEEQKISLHAALKHLFKTNPDLVHASRIKMAGRCLSVEDFTMQLRQLETEAIQDVVTPYLENYRGGDEHLWPIFSVLNAFDAISYAHKRLSNLLEREDYSGLQESLCLQTLQLHLSKSRSIQKTLLSFLQTVELTDSTISNIDMLISRFGSKQQKSLWIQRREHYLLSRLNGVILNPSSASESDTLRAYLSSHPDWLASVSAKQSLANVLKTMRLKEWSEAQHDLVSTLSDNTLRQIYLIRLLKRILSDRVFAGRHMKHLPTENDISGRFELMKVPGFRLMCEKAIQRLRGQKRIDHLDAIRLLESLLSNGLATVLDYDDLSHEVDQLVAQFKEQLEVDVLAKEAISLMDNGDHDAAYSKIQRLRETHDYYQSIHHDKEREKARQSLVKIIKAIEERYRLPITDRRRLLPDEALRFVEMMPTLTEVEPLLWRLQHYDALSTLALDFQNDVFAVAKGKKMTIASLPLFIEALRRGVLILSEKEQREIALGLCAAKEGGHFSTLSSSTQRLLLDLLQHFKREGETLSEKERNVSKSKSTIRRNLPRRRILKKLPQELFGDVKPKKVVPITVTVKTEISRQIIEDMQTSETCEESLKLMQLVLTTKEKDLFNQVTQDLFCYFCDAYRISVGQVEAEESVRIHARIQLKRIQYLVNKLSLSPNNLVALFAGKYEDIANQFLAMTLSLKAIMDDHQRELPELGQLVGLCIKLDIIDADLRSQWILYLTDKVLPYVARNSSAVSIQLAAALPSLLRILEGNELEKDLQCIVAYEHYYRDRVQAGVKRTDKVRMISSRSSSTMSSPGAGVDSSRQPIQSFVLRH